jgi:hypothetical protein
MCAVVWILAGLPPENVHFCDPGAAVDTELRRICMANVAVQTFVTMADVSPTPEALADLMRYQWLETTVLDHHRTSERLLGRSFTGVGSENHCDVRVEMGPGVCGCTLLLRHLFGDPAEGTWQMKYEGLIETVDIIAQFDSWTERRDEAIDLIMLHRVLGQRGFVERCTASGPESCRPRVSRFEAPFVQAQRQKSDERIREDSARSWETTMVHPVTGRRVLAAVTALSGPATYSLAEVLKTHPTATFAFGVNPVTGYVSVRSRRPEDDCSKIAELMGGGGHACAAAFTYTPSLHLDVRQFLSKIQEGHR